MKKFPVIDTLKYVSRFAGQTLVIKLGGSALQDEKLVSSLCDDLALIRSVGVKLVIVHGGGPSINQELTTHGITWNFIEGQRVTTPEMMHVVEMVLCGQVNRRIVRTLNSAGVKAIGVSGTDAALLKCKAMSEALGRVGEIQEVDTQYLGDLLKSQQGPGQGYLPVIAPVGFSEDGNAWNINADWAACRVAESLGVKKLIYLTDQDGILDASKQKISEVDAAELAQLMEQGVVQGGMLAKVKTVMHGLENGLDSIHILNAKQPHLLVQELFTSEGVGTVCVKRSRYVEA